ncbi:MAG: hypothetical protein EPN21_20770 [Methylococcaceae bacterium]|nr:MAG: hypothetical protein EPN21_20770 [Methylococcaceae bacterium]
MKKKSTFYHMRKRTYGMTTLEQAADFFGAKIEDIQEWDDKGAPKAIMKLTGLFYGDLSVAHKDWAGFRICPSGVLMLSPSRTVFRAEMLRNLNAFWRELDSTRCERDAYKNRLENILGYSVIRPTQSIILPFGTRF